jgi:hypothetical protein
MNKKNSQNTVEQMSQQSTDANLRCCCRGADLKAVCLRKMAVCLPKAKQVLRLRIKMMQISP